METNNPIDALRSAGNEFTLSTDVDLRVPDFAKLSQRRNNRRLLVGAALALGLMVPAAASFLNGRDSAPQLANAVKGASKTEGTKSNPTVANVAALKIASKELGLSTTETISKDQGFRSNPDGFNFPNYGGVSSSDAIDTTVMVALFGRSNVCANKAGKTCVELPGATDVKSQLNDALAAGRCEGFAALAQRFYDGLEKRPARASKTIALLQPQVAKQINYWWATQVAPTVFSSTNQYRQMAPTAIVKSIVKGLGKKTGFTLGLYSPVGGHSITPLAVTKDGVNWNIYVYDNNYPNEIRKVVVDSASETWTYVGGSTLDPSATPETWTGTGAGSMDITPMSVRKGPFKVAFGSTEVAKRGDAYRVLVTQKLDKGDISDTQVGAEFRVGDKSVQSTDYVKAANYPFNVRNFLSGSRGVGVMAYIPVISGKAGEVRIQPTSTSTKGVLAVSMDRPGLPALYAASQGTFTMVGQDGATTQSITLEGITNKILIRASFGPLSHSFTLDKDYKFQISATDPRITYTVFGPSGKILDQGVIPVSIPSGTVVNLIHSFNPVTNKWTTTPVNATATTIDTYFVENLTLDPQSGTKRVSNKVTTTTTPPNLGIQLPLRAIANTTTTIAAPAPTTTTLAPEDVSVSVAGTRSYGSDDSSINWKWTCDGSADGCTWAKAQFDANKLEVKVSATKSSAASDTPYSGTMSLVDGVTAPSTIKLATSVALTVEPRALTVSADANSKTYGEKDPALTATTVGLVEGDNLVGDLSRDTGENVGTFDITLGTVTDANNPNYKINFTQGTFTINALAVTVIPDANQAKTYGDADPTFTYTTTPSLVGTDSFTGSMDRAAGSDVGTYALGLGDLANTNYTITLDATPVDFTINKKAVTVIPDASQAKTYGDSDPTFTYSTLGLETGDSFTGSMDRVAGSDVGTYALGLGDLANTNYTITLSDTPVDFTINTKAVTVIPDANQAKTYGDADPTLTYTTTPSLVGTDSFTGTLAYTGSDVGTYALGLGDLANTNYTITLDATPVDFTINKKAVTVTPDASQAKTYSASDPTLTYTTSPLSISLSGSLSRADGSGVGTYAITQGTMNTANNANYSVSFSDTPVNFTINKKAVTVTPSSGQSKTYGDVEPTFTYSTLGLETGDSFTGSMSRATGEDVGTYVLGLGDLANANYTITLSDTPVSFTINKKTVTVTPGSGQSKTYGDADPTLTYTTSPLSITLSGSLSRADGSGVGTYAITQGTMNTANNANYTVTFSGTPVNFTINKKAVTVTADNKTKLATTTADPAFTWTSSPALVSSDLSGTLTRVNTSNAAGVYAITQGTLTNTANPNYTITFVAGSLTITAPTPLSASVIAQNGTVTGSSNSYTASNGSKLTVSASGGGTGALTWTVSAGTCTIEEVDPSNPDSSRKAVFRNGKGSCTLRISRASDDNYSASSINVAFTWD